MTDEQKQNVINTFESKTNREKLEILAALSKPWIDQGAIKHPVNTLQEIFTLQDLSKGAEDILDKKVKTLSKIIGGGTGMTMGGSNKTKRKRPRIKRKK